MENVLTNLLSGLGGAIVGAILAAMWADHSAHDVQGKEWLHERKSAARLITIELLQNQTTLETFKSTRTWVPEWVSRIFWDSEGAKVSELLTPEELVTVGATYLYIQVLESGPIIGTTNLRRLSDADLPTLDAAIQGSQRAIESLRTHAGFNDAEYTRLREAARIEAANQGINR